ncbi:MAG: hypothetical protein WAK48_08850 [Candidatus Acidiferrum sp.]|jgi:hypothetical protein
MCPACLATLSMVVAGVISTGGATALAAKMISYRKNVKAPNVSGMSPAERETESPEEKEKQS